MLNIEESALIEECISLQDLKRGLFVSKNRNRWYLLLAKT